MLRLVDYAVVVGYDFEKSGMFPTEVFHLKKDVELDNFFGFKLWTLFYIFYETLVSSYFCMMLTYFNSTHLLYDDGFVEAQYLI